MSNYYGSRKDRIKVIRTIAQVIVLGILAVFVVWALFFPKTYQPYNPDDASVVSGADKGFLALSYFGVDRTGTSTLISTERLDEHLKALSDLGYVTITQEDILHYYQDGTPLPDKALFLFFEDGRQDTAIFTEKILEKYGMLGTMLTYAEKLENRENTFLAGPDLKKLVESTWWELGTNGYRLSYINVYDRYDRFLGELDAKEFVRLNDYMERDYNHYLMDYIRDKDGLPVESHQGMVNRITRDYDLMDRIYTEKLGYLPSLYVLMHSNTGMFGNIESVSDVNAQNMTRLFAMNFNREGYSLNDRTSSLYDLTRMQPQAYWYTNHLLMRIWDDLPDGEKETIQFVVGDTQAAENWSLVEGAAEFKPEQIILTCTPGGEGIMELTDAAWRDVSLSTRLTGNQLGTQTIYLRASDDLSEYISVTLEEDTLILSQTAGAGEESLCEIPLRTLDDEPAVSVEEDSWNALQAELSVRAEFADSLGEEAAMERSQQEAAKQQPATVAEGAQEYIPELDLNQLGDRKLEILLQGTDLQVLVDEKPAAHVQVADSNAGGIYLASASVAKTYSQRNLADDGYDGVFEQLVVSSPDGTVLYDNRLSGLAKVLDTAQVIFDAVVTWFINTF